MSSSDYCSVNRTLQVSNTVGFGSGELAETVTNERYELLLVDDDLKSRDYVGSKPHHRNDSPLHDAEYPENGAEKLVRGDARTIGLFGVAAILLLITAAALAITFTQRQTFVKVMSYNIDFSGSNPAWKSVVMEENPDIAVFIEVGEWDKFNNQLLNQYVAEFNAFFSTKRPYQGSVAQNNGVSNTGSAIMSRYPIVSTRQLNSLTLDNGSTFKPTHTLMVWGVNVNGKVVYVCGFYSKCCNGFDNTRERTMEGFINFLDSLGPVPVIMMGDFNSVSPSDANPTNPNYNADFRPARHSNLGFGPLTMLLYPDDATYGKFSSQGVHRFTDTFRAVNNGCGVSRGRCCTQTCQYNDGSTCIERGYTFHDGTFDSRIDFIIANQFITVWGPATVGDTASACEGSDHFALDNHLII